METPDRANVSHSGRRQEPPSHRRGQETESLSSTEFLQVKACQSFRHSVRNPGYGFEVWLGRRASAVLAVGGSKRVFQLRQEAGLGGLLVVFAPVKRRKRQLSCHGGRPGRIRDEPVATATFLPSASNTSEV